MQARAPAQLRTSLQAIATAAMGLGMVAGYLGGGALLQHLGGSALYTAAATAAAVAAAFYALAGARTRRAC